MKNLTEFYRGFPTGLKDKNGSEIKFGDIVKCDKENWYQLEKKLGKDISKLPDYQEEVIFDYELLCMRRYDYPENWEIVS